MALSDDSLAALTNRGLLKRAVREVAEGKGPTLDESDDGTVTAAFVDGVTVVLAPDTTIEASRCTCPAPGLCRHRLMLAITYRDIRSAAAIPTHSDQEDSTSSSSWSPGQFSDEDLENQLGSRTLAVARKTLRAGYQARVRRATATDPVPTVELASCTVRFLVPEQLDYARVDAARGSREDAIALAVWAFRHADDIDPAAAIIDCQPGDTNAKTNGHGSGIESVLSVLNELIADGITGVGPQIATSIAQARRRLDAQNLRWPVDVLDDLTDQIEGYRDRHSHYQPSLAAGYIAELIGRHRNVTGVGASLRVQVLGTEEAAETHLRLLRLTGLGARVRGDRASQSIEIYLAHPEAGIVLALRRRVESDPDSPITAQDLGRRKAGGARLSAVSAGNVITESAVRSANRVLRIAESRLAKTTVAPSNGNWDSLPEGILVSDLEEEAARIAGLPPSIVRSRVVAQAVRAITVEDIEELRYLPGDQQLQATVRAPNGTARLVLTHNAAAPGAIDALAKALSGDGGKVRHIAGHIHRHGGGLDVEPTAVVTGSVLVIPAFADPTSETIATSTPVVSDRLKSAALEAIEISAELVHRGYRHLPATWNRRAEKSSQQLRQVGLAEAGSALGALASLARHDSDKIIDSWADTHIRLLVTAEQL